MKEIRKIVRQTLKEYISKTDLQSVDNYADDIFSDVGIDVAFTNHFLDRVNDPRNGRDITPDELKVLYAKAREKYGDTLSKLPPGSERVVNDTQTNINVPVVIGWDGKSPDLDMTAKTIMRKKDFKTSFESPKLKLETPDENIDVPINVGDTVLGGKFKNKKIFVKQIDKNDKGDITINDKPLLRVRTMKENFDEPIKDVNQEFENQCRHSRFNSLKDFTLGEIADNWNKVKSIKNDNIDTIKFFIDKINKGEKIDCLIYDNKGLADGFHRLIAMKIKGIKSFCYQYDKNY